MGFDRRYGLKFKTKRFLFLDHIHVTSDNTTAVAVVKGREPTGRMLTAFIPFKDVSSRKNIVCCAKKWERQRAQPRHRLPIPKNVFKEIKKYAEQTFYLCNHKD